MSRYPATSTTVALVRGAVRLALLLALGITALTWSTDETGGEKVLLLSTAGLMLLIATWGAVQTGREAQLFRAARGARSEVSGRAALRPCELRGPAPVPHSGTTR